jgi:hypothetical protein
LEQTSRRKICILGVLHEYQFKVVRKNYLRTVGDLVAIHDVDLVAEEGLPTTYAKQWVEARREKGKLDVEWKNVDLDDDERKGIPDNNPKGIGTLQDLDFQIARESMWVVRTSQATKRSALLICGWAHTFSAAEKFRGAGFTVEVNVFLDEQDVPV